MGLGLQDCYYYKTKERGKWLGGGRRLHKKASVGLDMLKISLFG